MTSLVRWLNVLGMDVPERDTFAANWNDGVVAGGDLRSSPH